MAPGNPFDGEARYYDIFHRDKDYAGEAEEIRRKFPDAKTVFEIGCGTGNLTVELAKLGFEVDCIEPSGAMLKRYKGGAAWMGQISIQHYPGWGRRERYDLVIATYDALNYVPFDEIKEVRKKILALGKENYIETWNRRAPIRWLTHKRANGCHRVRIGFGYRGHAHLWYIFWGEGLVISHHHLYLHRIC